MHQVSATKRRITLLTNFTVTCGEKYGLKVIKCLLNSTAQGGENSYPNTKPKKEANANLNLDVKWWFSLCTYHFLPRGRLPGNPWEARANGLGLVFLFSPRGRGVG